MILNNVEKNLVSYFPDRCCLLYMDIKEYDVTDYVNDVQSVFAWSYQAVITNIITLMLSVSQWFPTIPTKSET